MPFDEIMGVGREPRTMASISTYDTGTINEDLIIGSTEELIIPLGSMERVVSVNVSLVANPAGGVPFGSAIGAKFSVFLNEAPVATYALPSNNDWSSNVNDIIPQQFDTNQNSFLRIVSGADSGASYNFFYRVQVYAIRI